MATKAPRGRRPAGSPDARAAILEAAVEMFAERGFDRTTIRGVAARAEVDPALVHHYFGDKDGLLAESIALPVDPAGLLSGLAGREGPVGADLVLGVLTLYESDPEALSRLKALLRTALSHEAAAERLRALIEEALLSPLKALTASDHRHLRAGLAASQMIGVLLGRYVLKAPALADSPREALAAAVGATIDRYLRDPLP